MTLVDLDLFYGTVTFCIVGFSIGKYENGRLLSETMTACNLTVDRYRQLIALMKPTSNSLLTVPRRKFCCGSLLPVFSVRVSVTFRVTGVHIICSSVSVAECPPFGK